MVRRCTNNTFAKSSGFSIGLVCATVALSLIKLLEDSLEITDCEQWAVNYGNIISMKWIPQVWVVWFNSHLFHPSIHMSTSFKPLHNILHSLIELQSATLLAHHVLQRGFWKVRFSYLICYQGGMYLAATGYSKSLSARELSGYQYQFTRIISKDFRQLWASNNRPVEAVDKEGLRQPNKQSWPFGHRSSPSINFWWPLLENRSRALCRPMEETTDRITAG